MGIFRPIFYLICFGYSLFLQASSVKLPKGFQKCNWNDPKLEECLVKGLQSGLPVLAKGLPEFGIPKIDPLDLGNIHIDQPPSSRIQLNETFYNLKVYGLSKAVVEYVKVEKNTPIVKSKIKITRPLIMNGTYSVVGKILSIPLIGNGRNHFVFRDFESSSELHFQAKQKHGELAWQWKRTLVDFNVTKVDMTLENLFNGNKELGENMNRFLNENWSLLYEELKPAFNAAITNVYTEIVRRFFEHINIKEAFPQKDSFTIIDPNTNSLNYVYGDTMQPAETNYPPETRIKVFRKMHCIVTTAVATAIIIIAAIMSIRYFPHRDNSLTPENTAEPLDSTPIQKFDIPVRNPEFSRRLKRNRTDAQSDVNRMGNMKYIIEPVNYEIYIQLKDKLLDSTAFHANASVELISREPVKYIIIGASELRIISVDLLNIDGIKDTDGDMQPSPIDMTINSYDSDSGILIIQVRHSLTPYRRYLLRVQYEGTLQQAPYGLFKTTYTVPETQVIKTLISANTEDPFARTIFPYFGSTTQTATYNLHICRPQSMTTTTSSSYANSTHDRWKDCTWDTFHSTPEIPACLLGFVVTDYAFAQTSTEQGIIITIWTPIKRSAKAISYLQDIIPQIIYTFEDYFGLSFPTDSVDIYCVPNIMPYQKSKLGIIIVPESHAVLQKERPSEYQKETIAKTAALHLAEQWIDYMVMLENEDQWIKESLIQYLQYLAVDTIQPKWRILEEFYTSVVLSEMDILTLNPSQKAINIAMLKYPNMRNRLYAINETSVFRSHEHYWSVFHSNNDGHRIDPAIYSELFEPRSINKGICLFRKLQHILTETVFRNSIKKFLQFSKGKIVSGDDLWTIMTAEATNTTLPGYELLPNHMTLKTIVNEWIFNKDYPILRVTRKYDTNATAAAMLFVQTLDSHDGAVSYRKNNRHIPISYTTGLEKQFSATTPRLWLRSIKQTNNFVELSTDTWLLVNPQQTALYRVNYDETNWRMLKDSLEKGELPTTIRAQLYDDVLFLGLRGQLDYEFALNFTRSLSVNGEKEYAVWNTVLRHFQFLENILISINTDGSLNKIHATFNDYIKYLLQPIFSSFNFYKTNIYERKSSADDKEYDHSDLLWQTDIYSWACKVGIEECTTKVRMEFNKWKNNSNPDNENPINPNIRYATLCSIMRNGEAADFEFLFYRYLNTTQTDPNKYLYLKSLYCYRQINRTIYSILSDTLLDEYSLPHLFEISNIWQTLAENAIASTSPFDYVLTHWKSILKKYSEYTPILTNIIEGSTVNLCKEDHLNAIYRLREDLKDNLGSVKDVFTDVIRYTKYRINWKHHELHIFLSWLKKISVDIHKSSTNE